MPTRLSLLLIALAALPLMSCGGPAYEASRSAAPNALVAQGEAPAEKEAAQDPLAVGGEASAAVPRKIIYTATVDLVVKDFAEVDQKIQSLTQEYGGFISEFREDRSYGDQRAGRWVIRAPVQRFQEFLDKIVALGVPETRQIDAQDVTEEYVDLEARMANKRKLEERILALLEKQAGEIKDVIAVETELARVREEIERMEGRLRYLANRAELTTITITAREDVDYVPPQAPTFVSKVQSTWSQSLSTLGAAAEAFALLVVALVPWLAVLLVVATPFAVWAARSSRRRSIGMAEAVERP